jgi:hypothetical protein
VTHAIVLIQAERTELGTLGGVLAGVGAPAAVTTVAFEAYSRHDLEALFSIGQ